MLIEKSKVEEISNNILEKIAGYFNLQGKTLASILIFIFNNVVFIPLLSTCVFISYMLENGFFSYDFFADGLFGMKVFTYTLIIIMFGLAFGLFGSLSLYTLRKKQIEDNKHPKDCISIRFIIFMVFVNIVMILIFTISGMSHSFTIEKLSFIAIFLAISFYLSLHIGYVFTSKARQQIVATFVLVLMVTMLLIFARTHVNIVLGDALRMFGVGGNLEINVITNHQVTNGKLIFLGPQNIYYKTHQSNNLIIRDVKGLEIHILRNGQTNIKANN